MPLNSSYTTKLFILHYTIYGPIEGYKRKSTKRIEWNASLEETFNKLKSLIVNAPTLAIPDPNQTFEVEMDASDYAIAAALFQMGRPNAFES